jgi:hypothetical protein
MQNVHLSCPQQKLHSLLAAFGEQFQAQQEEITLIDYGYTQKQVSGYIVIEWIDEVDEAFLKQLDADPDILDYSVYTVPYITDELLPFGSELAWS